MSLLLLLEENARFCVSQKSNGSYRSNHSLWFLTDNVSSIRYIYENKNPDEISRKGSTRTANFREIYENCKFVLLVIFAMLVKFADLVHG